MSSGGQSSVVYRNGNIEIVENCLSENAWNNLTIDDNGIVNPRFGTDPIIDIENQINVFKSKNLPKPEFCCNPKCEMKGKIFAISYIDI